MIGVGRVPLWQHAAWALACYVVTDLSFAFRTLPGNISPIWPASGVALAAVLLCGRPIDRKSTRLNSSHIQKSRMPSSA